MSTGTAAGQWDALNAGSSMRITKAFGDCIRDLCSSLHLQAGVLRHCTDLHPHPPASLTHVLESALEVLNSAIDRSCTDIIAAACSTHNSNGDLYATTTLATESSIVAVRKPAPTMQRPHAPAAWCCIGKDLNGAVAHCDDVELEIPSLQTAEAARVFVADSGLDKMHVEQMEGNGFKDHVGNGNTLSPRSSADKGHIKFSEAVDITEEDEYELEHYESEDQAFPEPNSPTMSARSGKSRGSTPMSANGNPRHSVSAALYEELMESRSTFIRHSSESPSAPKMSMCEQVELQDEEETDEDAPMGMWVDGVLNPNWPGRLSWDLGVIVLVLIDAMILPFQMAFEENSSFFLDVFWLWLTTGFFALDMIFSVMTAYTSDDQLITGKRKILRNYLKTWFPIDFASTIPWGKFADLISGGGSSARSAQMAKLTKVVKFVRFLRLMRMLRLAKLVTIWERVEAHLGSLLLKQSVALFRVLFVLTGICHWNACIWWMIGQPTSLFTEMLSGKARSEWMSQRHWTTEKHGPLDEQFTWLEREKFEKYIFCFYWSLGVMRTMPAEVQPVNKVERLYVMVFMFFAFSAFAICVALITQTFFKFSDRKRVFDDDMAAVRMHMRQIDAPEGVQSSVKAFLKHLFDRRRIQARESSMLNHLQSHAPSIHSQLKFARFGKYVQKLTIVRDMHQKAAHYVCELAEVRDMTKGMCLCKKDRKIEAAFVVVTGRFQIREDAEKPEGDRPFIGDVIDEECLQTPKTMSAKRTILSIMPAEVLRIDRERFFKMCKDHQDFAGHDISRELSVCFLDDQDFMDARSTASQRTTNNHNVLMASTAVIAC